VKKAPSTINSNSLLQRLPRTTWLWISTRWPQQSTCTCKGIRPAMKGSKLY